MSQGSESGAVRRGTRNVGRGYRDEVLGPQETEVCPDTAVRSADAAASQGEGGGRKSEEGERGEGWWRSSRRGGEETT